MTACRAGKAPVSFVETKNGKLMPVDPDGTSHFATCPEAPRFKQPAPPQDICLGCGSRDLERRPGQGPHYGAIKCRDCGQFRWLRRPA